ncbi:hypothetical protein GCM10022234_22370 [Aeromicrobium panaciterrae]|uniref:AMP-binding protein n=1 Tax=Aeromicrobium panaciterrae TaxID=363861 RepID=UPI0031E318B0
MTFSTLPDRRAATHPDDPALADSRRTLTNGDFFVHVQMAASQLSDLGINAGDVVALKLTNRVEFVILLFAAWRIGATITPVNPALTDLEVARQLDDSRARLMVVEDGIPAIGTVPRLEVGRLGQGDSVPDGAPHADAEALALLIYTSGTTGTPKGVMLDHANLDAMTEMGSRHSR